MLVSAIRVEMFVVEVASNQYKDRLRWELHDDSQGRGRGEQLVLCGALRGSGCQDQQASAGSTRQFAVPSYNIATEASMPGINSILSVLLLWHYLR